MRRGGPPVVVLVLLLVALAVGGAVVAPAPAVPRAQADDCRAGRIALTFDDGPNGSLTRRLLRELVDLRVPATFFVVGQRVAAQPEVLRATERAGFLLANHSWAHVAMDTQSAAEVRSSLLRTQSAMRRAGVHPTDLMRPPYGALDREASAAIRSVGLVPVLWSVDPRDWAGGGPEEIADRVLGGLRGGSNLVLLHDGVGNSPASVAAVPLVVRRARDRGYCFVALDERGHLGFPTPRADLDLADDVVREGRRTRIAVRLDRPAGREVSVRGRVLRRTAEPGDDVTALDRTVRVPAGRLSASVPIKVRADGRDEPDERFEVRLSAPRGVDLGRSGSVVRVVDGDPPPRLRGDSVEVTEPVAGTVEVTAAFTLDRASGKAVSFVVEVAASSTADADDAVVLDRRVRIAPGERRGEVVVRVRADALDEAAETLVLHTSGLRSARRGEPSVVTILPPPQDPPPPRRR